MRLFNDKWRFIKLGNSSTYADFKDNKENMLSIGLPHDWLIYNVKNLYESSKGWYLRTLNVDEGLEDKSYILIFDGIYMDSEIFVNSKKVFEWKYGYSTFEVDITKFLNLGENEIVVSVNYISPNSRWYSGAGIYRNVYLDIVPKAHIINNSIYFHADKYEDVWKVFVNAKVSEFSENYKAIIDLKYIGDNKKNYHFIVDILDNKIEAEFDVQLPFVWDIDKCNLYELTISLVNKSLEKCILHKVSEIVGFREIAIDPNKGFSLNGRFIKLKGVCEHGDLGALGAAFNKSALERRLLLLKKMGVNAIRTAHNMPAREFLQLCDEMGFLVINEAYDMWEISKTEYDYARFFKEWYKKDISSWIRRDRNHPSIIMWSIGNEISDTNLKNLGFEWAVKLLKEVDIHDYMKNAFRTIGSNYMPWENAQKVSELVDVVGYNYGEKYYKIHHKKNPNWVIYGSETSSIVSSRGVYHFPKNISILTEDDLQCSGLGNSSTSWGAKSMEECLLSDVECEFSAGQFLWSGFDYIGEPTPYHTKNSYFGQIDTAGFPKDSYYIVQSAWTDFKTNPMIHICPWWDFNDNQLIDIVVASNAPKVELFLNEKSLGKQELNKIRKKGFLGSWQIPYENGELVAIAFDENDKEITKCIRHSFKDAKQIEVMLSKDIINADCSELVFAEVFVKDEDGNVVENANNLINISTEGGYIVGMDNGDSTDTTEYKTNSKRLFNGKLSVIIKAKTNADKIKLEFTSKGLKKAEARLLINKNIAIIEGISEKAYLRLEDLGYKKDDFDNKEDETIIPRNIKLFIKGTKELSPKQPKSSVLATFQPENSKSDIIWEIVDEKGIPSNIARLEVNDNIANITAISDGKFRLKAMSKSDRIKFISSLEFSISGFGKASINPYEFVSAGLYSFSQGEIGNGNEKGVATPSDNVSIVGFEDIDFGNVGSDTIKLQVFALTDDEYEFEIYEGKPNESPKLLGTFIYQMPKRWNIYQEVKWKLNKQLKGVKSIYFLLKSKVHIKGFIFEKYNKALFSLGAKEVSNIYGDSYNIVDDKIMNIGNNVTVEYSELDFRNNKRSKIVIEGDTKLLENAIILEIKDKNKQEKCMLSFKRGNSKQTFDIPVLEDISDIKLIFLPGSKFDLYKIEFL